MCNAELFNDRQISFFTKGSYHIGQLKESMYAYKNFNIGRCLLCITTNNHFKTNNPNINGLKDN